MAKITRTQQWRLVASSSAVIMAAAIMMPTTTDARGGGGHSGSGFHFGVSGFARSHPLTPSSAQFLIVRNIPPHHVFSHRHVAFHHSHGIRSHFFTLGPDSFWVDNFASPPSLVVTQEPPVTLERAPPRRAAVVRTPDAERDGILLVRGNNKDWVTFPSAKRG